MKKLVLFFKPLLIFFAVVMVVGIVFFSIHYTINPLKGRLQSATISKEFFGSITNKVLEEREIIHKFIVITNVQKLTELEELLKVETTPGQLNSMEEMPRYKMLVTYTNGSSGIFSFSAREWEGGGRDGITPPHLLEFLTNNGL